MVERVEPGQGDELERIPQLPEFLLELGDRVRVEVLAPVERRRAVVGEQLVRVLRLDRFGECPGGLQVRCGGLHPQQIRVRRVRPAAGDARLQAVAYPVEALGGALPGQEWPVTLVHVAGDQRRGLGVGAGDHQGGHAGHVGGEPGGGQGTDVRLGRDQHLATQVAALLLGGELVLPVHPGRTGGDHRLHQLVGVQHAAEAGLGVGHDRRQPVRAVAPVGIALRPADLVGAQQRVVDPAHQLRHRVGRVEALVRIGVPGVVGVGGHLPTRDVDRLEPGPHLLHRLATGHRPERGHVVLLLQQSPQPLRAEPGQRVLLLDTAAQPEYVVGGVGAGGRGPSRVLPPVRGQLGRIGAHAGVPGTR